MDHKKQTPKDAVSEGISALIVQLESGNSAALTAHLTAMGRFHNYSFGNVIVTVKLFPSLKAGHARRIRLLNCNQHVYQRNLYISGVCESCSQVHAADRVILYNVPTGGPSPCNDLCMFARGSSCECKCGGRNHGAGDLCTTQTIELFPDLMGVGA